MDGSGSIAIGVFTVTTMIFLGDISDLPVPLKIIFWSSGIIGLVNGLLLRIDQWTKRSRNQ